MPNYISNAMRSISGDRAYYEQRGRQEREQSQQRVKSGMAMFDFFETLSGLGHEFIEKPLEEEGLIERYAEKRPGMDIQREENWATGLFGESDIGRSVGEAVSDIFGMSEYSFQDDKGQRHIVGSKPAASYARVEEKYGLGPFGGLTQFAKAGRKQLGDKDKNAVIPGEDGTAAPYSTVGEGVDTDAWEGMGIDVSLYELANRRYK